MRAFNRTVLLLAALIVWASVASAENPRGKGSTYAGVEAGLGVINRYDPVIPGAGRTGFEVGGAAVLRVSHQWRDHIRFEGQLGWHGSAADGIQGRLDVTAATLNAYYDFSEPDAWVRPYLGVGLGVAGGWLRSDLPAAAGPLALRSGAGMAYVVEGGGRFPIGERLSLVGAWQFLGTVSLIDDGRGDTIDPTMHSFMVGIHTAF